MELNSVLKWHCCWLFFSLRINPWLAVMSPGWFGIVEWRLFQAQSENLLRIFQAFTLLSWAISLLIYIRPCTLCCASCGRGTKQNCVSWRDLNVRKYSKIMEASSKRKKIWSLMILLHLNTYYVCLNWRWLWKQMLNGTLCFLYKESSNHNPNVNKPPLKFKEVRDYKVLSLLE